MMAAYMFMDSIEYTVPDECIAKQLETLILAEIQKSLGCNTENSPYTCTEQLLKINLIESCESMVIDYYFLYLTQWRGILNVLIPISSNPS